MGLTRTSSRRPGRRAPPAPRQTLAVATRHPTLSVATHEYWDGACRVASESGQREAVLKKMPSAKLPHPKSVLPLGPPSSIFRKKNLKGHDVDKPAATQSASRASKLFQA